MRRLAMALLLPIAVCVSAQVAIAQSPPPHFPGGGGPPPVPLRATKSADISDSIQRAFRELQARVLAVRVRFVSAGVRL